MTGAEKRRQKTMSKADGARWDFEKKKTRALLRLEGHASDMASHKACMTLILLLGAVFLE